MFSLGLDSAGNGLFDELLDGLRDGGLDDGLDRWEFGIRFGLFGLGTVDFDLVIEGLLVVSLMGYRYSTLGLQVNVANIRDGRRYNTLNPQIVHDSTLF